jgi:hypothetical protein
MIAVGFRLNRLYFTNQFEQYFDGGILKAIHILLHTTIISADKTTILQTETDY